MDGEPAPPPPSPSLVSDGHCPGRRTELPVSMRHGGKLHAHSPISQKLELSTSVQRRVSATIWKTYARGNVKNNPPIPCKHPRVWD